MAFGALLTLTSGLVPAPAWADCKIEQIAELPVKVVDQRVLVSAKINGRPVKLFVDTGAPFTVLFPQGAASLHLPVHEANLRLSGVGGRSYTGEVTLDRLSFGNFSLSKSSVYVAGAQDGPDAPVGLVGRDMFGDDDVEIDLAHNVIRRLRPKGCLAEQMVYWAPSSYSEAPLDPRNLFLQPYVTRMLLNGHPLPVTVDSGAPRTIATAAAARAVGVTPDSVGSILAEHVGGLGTRRIPSFTGQFATVGIGDEVVKNTRLFVADLFRYNKVEAIGTRLGAEDTDEVFGLLGLDFLQSHRVLISSTQHRLMFSYVGGPVFDTSPPTVDVARSPAAAAPGRALVPPPH